MKRLLLLGAWTALAVPARAQIILTEVMYNPRASESANEFVELYNLSESDTIALAGWKIGDQNVLDEIISPQSKLELPPQHYAVILDPSYFQSSTQYDSLIPPKALVLTIADNTFGSGGFSNSTAETVILVDAEGDTIGKHAYSLGNPDGISEEKIHLTENDAAQNWANALRVDGTPGFANSVMPRRIDGELIASSLRISPASWREDSPATISLAMRNAGVIAVSQFSIDFDLIPTGREFGAPIYLGNLSSSRELAAAESVQLDFNATNLRPGKYRLLATLALAEDANAANDTASIRIAVGWRREAIIINEVMFDPGSGQPEWIEIYNPQTFSMPLGEWLVEDESSSKSTPAPRLEIPPSRYRVLTASVETAALFGLADTSVILLNRLPSFNNSGDAVLLRDFSGALIDSLFYDGDWGKPGKSLEKIWHERANNQRNWLQSRAARGATPAAFNSVSPRAYNLEIRPLRFDPQRPNFGESIRLEAPVFNRGRRAISNFTASFLFDTTGARNWQNASLLQVLRSERELTPEDSMLFVLTWEKPPPGSISLAAILEAEGDEIARDDSTFAFLNVSFGSRAVVINEVMFDPITGQPDWIELFNPNLQHISLANWSLEDETGSRAIFSRSAALPPQAYRAVTSSLQLATLFNLPDSVIIIASNFPALNQAGDAVVLRDANGRAIDSLRYESAWAASGKSLEKVWFEKENLRNNWGPSRAALGATPAGFNSISPREYDLAISSLEASPTRLRAAEEANLIAKIMNRGRRAVSNFSVSFYYAANALPNQEKTVWLAELPVAQELKAEDSLRVNLQWPQPPSGKIKLLAEVSAADDVIAENNHATAELPVGYPAKAMVLNEIYYAPLSGEIEWFEILNRSSTPVNLSEWLWQDRDAASAAILSDSTIILKPGAFAVISAAGAIANLHEDARHLPSTKWLTLNNDEEKIKLWDFNLGLHDSLRFSSRWGGASGVSLERINPHLATQDSTNWSSCVDRSGATPGRANSILTIALPSAVALNVSPNPFSPDEDGFDDFALFQINLPVTTAAMHMKIYDLRGRLIRHLLNNQSAGSHYETIWNGRDDRGERVRTGLYIVYLKALRADQGVLLEAKSTIVVARRSN